MEHNDAVRLQAVEKYILGELSPAVRDEFEAHYFDCAVCSFNLRAGVAFAAGARQFFAEAPARTLPASAPRSNWLSWLPRFAVPAFAALLLVVGYQNIVSIPKLQQTAQTSHSDGVVPGFSLVDSNVKGAAGKTIHVRQGQSFTVFFDITATPKSADSVFLVELTDPTGRIISSSPVSQEEAQRPVFYHVSALTQDGQYKLVISENAAGTVTKLSEVPFTVAF
jgi:hypothetical protein